MNEDCLFCKISKGELPSHMVYEDDYCFAFLDKHPINAGHMLVVPKNHEPDFYKLPEDQYLALFKVVKKLSGVVQKQMNPHKVGIIIAGWDIPHAHVHIVPMHDYHDITSKSLLEGKVSNPTDEELKETTEKLKSGFQYFPSRR